MRNEVNVDRIDRVFNLIERVRRQRISRRLKSQSFVKQHFPFQELAALKAVSSLSALQSDLMMQAS